MSGYVGGVIVGLAVFFSANFLALGAQYSEGVKRYEDCSHKHLLGMIALKANLDIKKVSELPDNSQGNEKAYFDLAQKYYYHFKGIEETRSTELNKNRICGSAFDSSFGEGRPELTINKLLFKGSSDSRWTLVKVLEVIEKICYYLSQSISESNEPDNWFADLNRIAGEFNKSSLRFFDLESSTRSTHYNDNSFKLREKFHTDEKSPKQKTKQEIKETNLLKIDDDSYFVKVKCGDVFYSGTLVRVQEIHQNGIFINATLGHGSCTITRRHNGNILYKRNIDGFSYKGILVNESMLSNPKVEKQKRDLLRKKKFLEGLERRNKGVNSK